jgi:hypothetical protein
MPNLTGANGDDYELVYNIRLVLLLVRIYIILYYINITRTLVLLVVYYIMYES